MVIRDQRVSKKSNYQERTSYNLHSPEKNHYLSCKESTMLSTFVFKMNR